MPTEFERFIRLARHERGGLFAAEAPVTAARAPGWVDLVGGAAAAGGALALGWPLGGGSFVALQPSAEPALLVHTGPGSGGALPLAELQRGDGSPCEYAEVAARLAALDRQQRIVGAVWLALLREEFVRFPGGASILAQPAAAPGSDLGLAAAVAQALVSACGIRLAPRELAYVVQTALARAVGCDPGALGALVSVCAHAGSLLQVHQQPRWLWGELHMPPGTTLWAIGLDGSPPPAASARLRAATAMAYVCAAEAAGMSLEQAGGHWLGYLANLGTPYFEARVRGRLPAQLSGQEFVERYGALGGLALEPEHSYPVRAAAALAVEEHLRARMTAALLRAAASKAQRDEDLTLAGELMARSHGSRRAAGLGDPRADALVELIYHEGAARGLFGACAAAVEAGVTLVVLGRSDAEPALRAIAASFGRAAGLAVAVYGGSSSGASAAGTREV